MKTDPFADPPSPRDVNKRHVPPGVTAAATVFFFALAGTAVTVLVAVSVALWRWIV